jgi:hypothetical protein
LAESELQAFPVCRFKAAAAVQRAAEKHIKFATVTRLYFLIIFVKKWKIDVFYSKQSYVYYTKK